MLKCVFVLQIISGLFLSSCSKSNLQDSLASSEASSDNEPANLVHSNIAKEGSSPNTDYLAQNAEPLKVGLGEPAIKGGEQFEYLSARGGGSQGALKKSRTGNSDQYNDDDGNIITRGSCAYQVLLFAGQTINVPENYCCDDNSDCQIALSGEFEGRCNANMCLDDFSLLEESCDIIGDNSCDGSQSCSVGFENCSIGQCENNECVLDNPQIEEACSVVGDKSCEGSGRCAVRLEGCFGQCRPEYPCRDGACCVTYSVEEEATACFNDTVLCTNTSLIGIDSVFDPDETCSNKNFCITTGACCDKNDNNSCSQKPKEECVGDNFEYKGDGILCSLVSCSP